MSGSTSPCRWPPEDDAGDSRQHQFASGEGRTARQLRAPFRKRRDLILRALGGSEKARAKFLAFAGGWAGQFPGPLQETNSDVLEPFSLWLESLMHGDEHSLLKAWGDRYAPDGNFVVPFPLIDPWQQEGEDGEGAPPPAITAHCWVIVNRPEDHLRIATDHPQKSPFNAAILYGKNFLAHVDNDEWRRRRFGLISAVAPSAIQTYFHKMERHARELVSRLQQPVNGTMLSVCTL